MTILPFTPGRFAWLAVPITALIAVSVLLNPQSWADSPWWVYVCLGSFYFVVLVLPLILKRRAWLKLDHQGMHVHMLFRPETYRWRDIESFVPVTLEHGPVPMIRFVGINFRGTPPRLPAWLAPFMQRVNGYHRSVPAWFGGLNAVELCDLLEQWRIKPQ